MEKYTYYNKINTQMRIIENINEPKIVGDLKLKCIIDRNSFGLGIFERLRMYYDTREDAVQIYFDSKYHKIKVEEKYKQDMLNLFRNNKY